MVFCWHQNSQLFFSGTFFRSFFSKKKKNVFATEKSASVSRVDIGGTTYVETRQGILERMYDHQTRTVVK